MMCIPKIAGIKYYGAFIDTYKKEGVLPATLEDDDVRGVLMCHFCMARLNSKYYTLDRDTKRSYLLKEKEVGEKLILWPPLE